MAMKSRKTATKKKTTTSKRTAATRLKGAPRTKGSAADARKEYAALHQRAQGIWKDFDSSDAVRSKRAADAWTKFLADFQAWAKKYGLKVMQQEKKHDATGEPTPFSHSANTHGCAPSYSGHTPGGNAFVCHFVRYSRVRGACIYTCGFDPDGSAIPPQFM